MSSQTDMRTVADIMAGDVEPVTPETTIDAAVRWLLDRSLPGLPVVDSIGHVVGVVSERALVARPGSPRHRPWWWLLADRAELAREYRKDMGTTVGDVMTGPVETVAPTAPLEAAVALLDEPDIDLVPVVSDGRLVGSVYRRDLVRILEVAPAANVWRSDTDLLTQMQERMAREPWISRPHPTVEAWNGVLSLWGIAGGDAEKAALSTMARSIPGCRGVEDYLIVLGPRYRYHEMV